MNQTEALKRVINLSEFSRKSGIPLRTLRHIRTGNTPGPTTAVAIDAALKKQKPAMTDKGE